MFTFIHNNLFTINITGCYKKIKFEQMRGIEPPSPTWKEGVMTIIRHLLKKWWIENIYLPFGTPPDAHCGPDRNRTYYLRIMSALL